MAVQHIVHATPVVEYDGGNAAEILAAIDPGAIASFAIALVSESGGHATFSWTDYGGSIFEFTTSAGDWVRVGAIGGNWGVASLAGERDGWIVVPEVP